MSVKVANSRFIVPSVTGFYQQLTRRVSSFQKLGSYLVKEAELAQAFRHTNRVEELGITLSNIPIKEYRLIGQYYMGWASYLRGERSREVFEKVAEQSHQYKAKGLISLAVIEAHRGDYTSELAYYNEALKCADNPSTKIDVLRAIAAIKAKEGCNRQSLRDLEKMWPLVRYGDLRVYHDYLNSLAVELGEAGRIQEAQEICKVVLASPFAFAYPEWQQTAAELQSGSRSIVQVDGSRNILSMPPVPEGVIQSPPAHPAKIFSLAQWKNKMAKEKNSEPDENLDQMDRKDLVVKMLELITPEDIDEEKLRNIVKHAVEVMARKK